MLTGNFSHPNGRLDVDRDAVAVDCHQLETANPVYSSIVISNRVSCLNAPPKMVKSRVLPLGLGLSGEWGVKLKSLVLSVLERADLKRIVDDLTIANVDHRCNSGL